MTNNGLKISEMTYSTIEDAVNNNAQVPVSAEIDGVKVNRRIPIKLITDGLITDNYVEKNPDNQDTQIINSPIKITSLNDTASLIVKGIIEISDTGTQDKNTYNIITMTDTLASSYTCIPNGKAHFYSYLNSGGYVMNNAGLNSDDGDGYYGHSITHQDSNAAIITKSRIEATKANVYAQNIIEANISNNIGYCNNLSAVYDGTNRVEVHESISPSMYNKVLSYHNSDLISIYINGLDNKLIKIDNINVELKSACIIDSDNRRGTEGQVLSSTGTGVAWVNQSSGGGGGGGGGTSISNTGTSIQTFVYAGASLFNSKNSEVVSGPTTYSHNTSIAINADFYNDVTGQASTIGDYPFNLNTFDDPAISGNTITIDEGYDYYITLDKVNFRYCGLYASDVAPTIQLTTPITIVFRYRESISGSAIIPSSSGLVSPYLYFEYVGDTAFTSKPITGNTWIRTSIAYTTTDTADTQGTGEIGVYAKYNYTTKKLLIMFDQIPSCRTYIKTPAVMGAFGINYDVTLVNGVFVPANTAFAIYGWPAYYPIPTIGSHYCMWILDPTPNTDSASINVPTYLGYSNTVGPSGGYVFDAGQLNGNADNSVYIMNVAMLPHVMCKADITLIKTNAT